MKSIAIALCLVVVVGCQSAATESPDMQRLRELLERAKTAGDAKTIDGERVEVTARVNLAHGRQQFLWLLLARKDVPSEKQCLQLIVPEEIGKQVPASMRTAKIKGELLVLGYNPADVYSSFKVGGVDVSPYCMAFPGVYLQVKEMTRK